MFNQKSRFRNFSNLYSMNRGENAGDKLAGELSEEEGHFNKAKNAAEARWASGDIASGNDALERAKGKAREISDRADAFNPAVAARKQGLAGQAAGVASFYGGQTSEANTQNLQRFRNLYSTVAGMQGRAIPVPQPKGPSVGPPRTKQHIDDLERNRNIAERQPIKGDRIVGKTELDYLLGKEQISLEDYYKAQNNPEFYAELMRKHGRNV